MTDYEAIPIASPSAYAEAAIAAQTLRLPEGLPVLGVLSVRQVLPVVQAPEGVRWTAVRRLLAWLREAWGLGPVFAVEAVLLALDALREVGEASGGR